MLKFPRHGNGFDVMGIPTSEVTIGFYAWNFGEEFEHIAGEVCGQRGLFTSCTNDGARVEFDKAAQEFLIITQILMKLVLKP
jgi:hypothetical protein